METILFYTIIGITVFNFLLERLLGWLNNSRKQAELPEEAKGIYDAERYAKWLAYDKARSKFGRWSSLVSFLGLQYMLWGGLFGTLDFALGQYVTDHEILLPLLYFGTLGLASGLLGLPFAYYSTFHIEARFGFNTTTLKTFIMDRVKGMLLGVVLGGGLGSLVIWFYQQYPENFWWIGWAVVSGFSILMSMFHTATFARLFNKLVPLEEGELRDAIEAYASKVGYNLKNIYVSDGSKRSTKANAYFSGLGPRKSIVLFDMLIQNHPTEEIVAVLAHEVGHYKKKHIPVSMVLGVLQMGLVFYLLSFVLKVPYFSVALSGRPSFHMALLAFSLLYTPFSTLLGLGMNALSRKNEFEADAFAGETADRTSMIEALKRLASDSLVNLTPHPLVTFFYASHPPILKRVEALKKIS